MTIETRTSGDVSHFMTARWVPSVSGNVFENRNPTNRDDLVRPVSAIHDEDVGAGDRCARLAYERWRLVPAPRRADCYSAPRSSSPSQGSARARHAREMGKVLDETRGDVQEAIDNDVLHARRRRRQYGQTVPRLRDKFAMSVRQPLGVCAIVTPWNFRWPFPVLEDTFGACVRQHRRVQAGDADGPSPR